MRARTLYGVSSHPLIAFGRKGQFSVIADFGRGVPAARCAAEPLPTSTLTLAGKWLESVPFKCALTLRRSAPLAGGQASSRKFRSFSRLAIPSSRCSSLQVRFTPREKSEIFPAGTPISLRSILKPTGTGSSWGSRLRGLGTQMFSSDAFVRV